MEVKQCTQKGNELNITFEVLNFQHRNNNITAKSREYVISGLITFQVKVHVFRYKWQSNDYGTQKMDYSESVFIRFVKTLRSDKLTYAIKCSSEELAMKDNMFLNDDTKWRLVHECSLNGVTTSTFIEPFSLNVVLILPSNNSPLASLYEDTELTDFELRAEDGSVHVHKAILAAYSPMLRAMVAGDWRESKERSVQVQGTMKETLQHLKDYMYSDKLPETGLEQLLLLASYYMMEDLEQKCSFKLLNNLSAGNAFELAEFAAKNKLKKLFFAIIENLQRGVAVKVEYMDG